MIRHALAIAFLALLVAGCKPGGAITCPTLRGYSPAFLAAAASELRAAESTSPHLVQMLNDYGVERDGIRACLKLRGG